MFTVANFPQQYVKGTNCLGFVLGKPGVFILEAGYTDPDTDRWITGDIMEAMANCLRENGFSVGTVPGNPNQFSITAGRQNPWDGRTAILVFRWSDIRNILGYYEKKDFHVIRVNPNGSVEHKPDAIKPPEKFDSLGDFYANTDYKPNELAGSFVLV